MLNRHGWTRVESADGDRSMAVLQYLVAGAAFAVALALAVAR
jgi:hypothetical protein